MRSANVAMPLPFVIWVTVPWSEREVAKIPTVTAAPPTGFPLKSRTRTVTGGLIATPAMAFDGCCTNAMSTKALAVFVRLNAAGVATPVVVAVTL